MKNRWLVLIVLVGVVYFWLKNTSEMPSQTAPTRKSPADPTPAAAQPPPAPTKLNLTNTNRPKRPQLRDNSSDNDDNSESEALALHYRIENGMYIVQGDVVAGAVLQGQTPPENGLVAMDPLKLWPKTIPYHIQPDVTDPDRIRQALKMFEGSAVRFVPYNNEDYALVFEVGSKNCYSYVGKVTDKQQIWISPDCSPADIAHEIMHALGFVHEQNRSDRDEFIDVAYDNIEEEFRYNFEKLPESYMTVTGRAPFDFQSLMLYPPWMFAKSGRSTMEPKNRDRLIDPLPRPSSGDLERLNRAYQ